VIKVWYLFLTRLSRIKQVVFVTFVGNIQNVTGSLRSKITYITRGIFWNEMQLVDRSLTVFWRNILSLTSRSKRKPSKLWAHWLLRGLVFEPKNGRSPLATVFSLHYFNQEISNGKSLQVMLWLKSFHTAWWYKLIGFMFVQGIQNISRLQQVKISGLLVFVYCLRSNRVGVFPFTWGQKQIQFLKCCSLVFNTGQWTKSKNSVILSDIHHWQNPFRIKTSRLHGIISQKIGLFIATAVRTSDLTNTRYEVFTLLRTDVVVVCAMILFSQVGGYQPFRSTYLLQLHFYMEI
jgi:hypothetical protein